MPALQADTYEQGLIAKGMVFAVIFLSFVVVTGIGGMVSLAQATFVIAGGFAAGWALNYDWGIDVPLIASHGQLNWFWAVVLAALVGAAAGAVVALPVRRLGAVALALGTFALAFIADLVIFAQEGIAHGSNGWFVRWPTLDLPLLPRYDFGNSEQRFVLFLIIFGLGTLMIHALMRSPTGRAMLAVRSTEVAARTSGIRPARPQILIFALSAGIAGLGGALLAMNDGTISNLSAPPVIGLVWIAVAVTFGIRRPGGALLAGLAFGGGSQLVFNWIGNDFLTGGLHDLITSPYFTTMLFGLGAINLAKNPDGLLAIIGTKKAEKRREKAARAPTSSPPKPSCTVTSRPRPTRSRAGSTRPSGRSRATRPRRRGRRQLGIVPTDAGSRRRPPPTADQAALLARRHRRRVRRGRGAARRVAQRPSRARSSRCSARTAPASRRCARSPPGWSSRRRGGCCSTATTSPTSRRCTGRGRACCSCPRPGASSPA